MKDIITRLLKKTPLVDKQDEELRFWQQELKNYQDWYDGRISSLYGVNSPNSKNKVAVTNKKDSALLTWLNLHQKVKYLKDLQLSKNSLKGKTVLDVGAGPMPSGSVFTGATVYCLDPLYGQYISTGFPIHYYQSVHFVNAPSEEIPLPDNFFDAVISVNAIDHVDSFHSTAQEIKRVLKKDGKLAMHVHYHEATPAEPIEITDKMFMDEYSWVKGLKKVNESTLKTGSTAGDGELYVLWRNF